MAGQVGYEGTQAGGDFGGAVHGDGTPERQQCPYVLQMQEVDRRGLARGAVAGGVVAGGGLFVTDEPGTEDPFCPVELGVVDGDAVNRSSRYIRGVRAESATRYQVPALANRPYGSTTTSPEGDSRWLWYPMRSRWPRRIGPISDAGAGSGVRA